MVDTQEGIQVIWAMNNLRNCDRRTEEERRHDTTVIMEGLANAGFDFPGYFEIGPNGKKVPSEHLYNWKGQLIIYQIVYRVWRGWPKSGLHWCDPTKPYKGSELQMAKWNAEIKAAQGDDDDDAVEIVGYIRH